MADPIPANVNPRLFPVQQPNKAAAPRRRGYDQSTRRALRQYANQRDQLTWGNKEWQEPEYLDSQRRYLTQDIHNIEMELIPLKQQFESLKAKEEASYNGGPENTMERLNKITQNEQRDISSAMKQSHVELEMAKAELAQMRRVYCEANKIRLEDEINEQLDQIDYYTATVQKQREHIEKYTTEIGKITNSEEAEQIRQQISVIQDLQSQLDSLQEIESGYIKQHEAMVDDVPIFIQMNGKVDNLKRKINLLEHKKITLKVELNKKKKAFEEKKRTLLQLIDNKNAERLARSRRQTAFSRKSPYQPPEEPEEESEPIDMEYNQPPQQNQPNLANHGRFIPEDDQTSEYSEEEELEESIVNVVPQQPENAAKIEAEVETETDEDEELVLNIKPPVFNKRTDDTINVPSVQLNEERYEMGAEEEEDCYSEYE